MSDHDAGPPAARRGLREVLGLLVRMSTTTAIVLVLTAIACAVGGAFSSAIVAVGAEVVAEASWFYPTALTGALAYLGIPFAQLVVNADGRSMARIRRLTPVVETAIAGVATAATLLAWVGAASRPTLWPHMWSIVLLWAAVTVVALGAGRMVLGNAVERLRVAEYELAAAVEEYQFQHYRQRFPEARRELSARVVVVMVTTALVTMSFMLWSELPLIMRYPEFIVEAAVISVLLVGVTIGVGAVIARFVRDRVGEASDRRFGLISSCLFGALPPLVSLLGVVFGGDDLLSAAPFLTAAAPLLCFVPGLGGVALVRLVRQARTTTVIDRYFRVEADVKALRAYVAERPAAAGPPAESRIVVEHTITHVTRAEHPQRRDVRITGRPRQRSTRRPRA